MDPAWVCKFTLNDDAGTFGKGKRECMGDALRGFQFRVLWTLGSLRQKAGRHADPRNIPLNIPKPQLGYVPRSLSRFSHIAIRLHAQLEAPHRRFGG